MIPAAGVACWAIYDTAETLARKAAGEPLYPYYFSRLRVVAWTDDGQALVLHPTTFTLELATSFSNFHRIEVEE